MHFTPEQMQQFMAAHRSAPQLSAPRQLQMSFPSSLSLLARLPYVPSERNQGWCGDCWQWAGTGVMEIAHDVQNGVHDRLSIQLINSCNDQVTCCAGGWLTTLSDFYAREGFAIPWANNNAQFNACGPCGNIATSPRYPIQSISTVTIPTYGVGQAQAIANIKSALNQNKAIWFGFFLWTGADWDQFFSFWDYQPETAVWSSFACGKTPDSGEGGHAVLCVGYDDSDPANPYWIMVNSWGTTSGRPNDIFRVSMNLDYDCAASYGWQSIYFQTLDIQFEAQPPIAPVITSQPNDQTVTPNQTAVFDVTATGNPGPGYQWQRLATGNKTWTTLTDGGNYSGTTTATLMVSATSSGMSGDKFRCIVGNSQGTALSSAAALSVIPFGLTTLAGQAQSSGYADGLLTQAKFFGPCAVAVDAAENIYVADGQNYVIRKVSSSGVVSTLAGSAGQYGSADGTGSAARFSVPSGVAVDSAGNVYVADCPNHTIRKITPAGIVSTLAGLAGFSGAADGSGSTARFYYPRDIAIDNTGNLYVADMNNDTIRKITPAGLVSTLAGLAGGYGSADGLGGNARFANPRGVAVDLMGNVYVSDGDNQTIRKITPTGVVTTLAGSPGLIGSVDGWSSNARFNAPGGITVDIRGNIYVADQFNSTIRRITPTGQVGTLAGLAGVSGASDGVAGDARLYYPFGVTLAPSGNLYVADDLNNTIRKYAFANFPLQLTAMSRSVGVAQFALNGPADVTCQVQSSSDLVHWAPLTTTVIPAQGRVFITDSGAANEPKRFYRATASVISIAATSGAITSPFVSANGYIYQPIETGVTTGGRAAYNFTIATAGNYVIQTLVNAPDGGANSFYVNIDAEPQDPFMIWNVPITSGSAQRTVSWKGNGTGVTTQFGPKVFSLTQGAHQLIIRGREANTQLQSLTIVPTP